MSQSYGSVNFEQVFKDELEIIKTKRNLLNSEDSSEKASNLFGIALSGGGIRSATINLGILEVFNKCGILKLADYLSTVSGGGYIGSYVHARLNSGSTPDAYNKLFSSENVEYLKKHGNYLIPGKGFAKSFNRFRFGGAFFFSVLMNWIWALSLLFLILFFLQGLFLMIPDNWWLKLGYAILISSAFTIGVHFFLHYLARFKIWSAGYLYLIEGLIFALIMLYGLHFATQAALNSTFLQHPWKWFFLSLPVFGVTGLFANPNIITLHAFYRDRISETFLRTKGEDYRSIKLKDIIIKSDQKEYCAPYPLINCCLNLQGENKNYSGIKTSDYFLLSPLYCGSKLTGYMPTNSPAFNDLMLSTATAISGAAVNPNMGTRTNRIFAFFMTLLNLRLGYWTFNPKKKIWPWIFNNIVWWPYYHVMELFCKTNAERRRVNISDGGHVENLGVYELLRRKCRLIIAIDASADPEYNFSDLNNLVVRARRELGIEIDFRQDPELYIKPKPSKGYSESHFVIADIRELPGKSEKKEDEYIGLLVYVKSSLRPQKKFHKMAGTSLADSFHYKSFHPAFPHESTIDQFFDEEQWEAYYYLGRFMAADLLKINIREKEETASGDCNFKTIDALRKFFEKIGDDAALKDHYAFYH